MPGVMDRAGRKQEQVPCALAGLLLPGEPEPCTVMGTFRRAGENAWNCGDTREERKKMPGIVGTLRRTEENAWNSEDTQDDRRKFLEVGGHSGREEENAWHCGDTQPGQGQGTAWKSKVLSVPPRASHTLGIWEAAGNNGQENSNVGQCTNSIRKRK